MAGYTNIRNSTANPGNYFTAAGAAINASNQPNIDDTVMAGTPDSALGRDMYGLVSKTYPVAFTGTERSNIIMGIPNTLRGSVNTSLKEGATPPTPISTPQMNSLQTRKVTTAIRAGQWHEISGVYAVSGVGRTNPATANDFAAIGNDNEADSNKSAPGKFTYNQVGGLPTNSGYGART